MKIRHFAGNLALAGALILATGAQAAPGAKESWIGAWGFVPTPLPPGMTPAPAAATPAAIPLGAAPAMPAPAAPNPPLLDNPGNVPVVIADSDPANVTIRQLVRVAVAGKRIRLRFSNEGGTDALTLGSVHVAAAGPDGSIIAGTDQAVTFDGNTGIGGNRLLRYGTGPSALARLDRDVLSVPGVKAVILLEGINDIGRGFYPPTEPVTADALIADDKQIIERAHAKGIKVYGATLTPYRGAHYFMADGEKVREAVNDWIKTGGAFDGVVDFAPSVADKSDPTTFDLNYNLNDKLHPNDAGYQAMANAIDLTPFK